MEEAIAVVEALRDADLESGMAFRFDPSPYPCSDPECGGFHVGNWSDAAYRNRPKNGPVCL